MSNDFPRYAIADADGNVVDYAQGIAGCNRYAFEYMKANNIRSSCSVINQRKELAVVGLSTTEALRIVQFQITDENDECPDIRIIRLDL